MLAPDIILQMAQQVALHVRTNLQIHTIPARAAVQTRVAGHVMQTIINPVHHARHVRPFHIPTVVHNPAASQTVAGLKPIHALVTAAPVQLALHLHRHVPAHPVAAAIHMVHAT